MTLYNNDSTVFITDDASIIAVRQTVLSHTKQLGFRVLDQTKLVTAVSELARNIVNYAGRGTMTVEIVANGLGRPGLKLAFNDRGPGIADIELALKDGYSTSGGLGLGLPGTRRLVDEFEMVSEPGEGTRILITKWVN